MSPMVVPASSSERVSRLWLREEETSWSLEDCMSWDRAKPAGRHRWIEQDSTGLESAIQRVPPGYSDYWSLDVYEENYPTPGKEIFERFRRNYIQCSHWLVYTGHMENFTIHGAWGRVLRASCLSSGNIKTKHCSGPQ